MPVLIHLIVDFVFSNSRVFLDPEPTCGVSSLPVLQGETVTLSCSMTYYFQSPQARLPPGALMSATISWESGAGTQTTHTPIDHTIADNDVVGHTIQVDAQRTVTETELPSYTCTTTFGFTDQTDPLYSFALNSVSWTCTSAAVLIFCMYLHLIPGNRHHHHHHHHF